MARRKYPREFKVSAVKLVNEQGYTIPAAGKSLGVDPNSIRGWIARFSSEPGMAPVGEGAAAAELVKLRKENARLLIEREILKKKGKGDTHLFSASRGLPRSLVVEDSPDRSADRPNWRP